MLRCIIWNIFTYLSEVLTASIVSAEDSHVHIAVW
jgi:hypothetical protein